MKNVEEKTQKICIVIPIWKRKWLSQHLLSYYHSFDSPGIQYTVVVVGSEGEESRKVARGLEYVEAPNDLLDRKYDIGFQHCKNLKPDAVVLVGSDDLITKDYFEWAIQEINSGTDLVGFLDFYFADITKNLEVSYWGGYEGKRKGQTIGAGRMISSRMLNKMKWKPFVQSISDPNCPDQRKLGGRYYGHEKDDERAEEKIIRMGGKIKTINMANIGCRYWAVKTKMAMNPINAFENNSVIKIMDNTKNLFIKDIGWPANFGKDLS